MRLPPPLPTFPLVIFSIGAALGVALTGCNKTGEVSRQKAHVAVEELAKVAATDVDEVRRGLPLGAKQLESFFAEDKNQGDAAAAKEALNRARNRVQDLRVAKSTFFVLADKSGVISRGDLERDSLAS